MREWNVKVNTREQKIIGQTKEWKVKIKGRKGKLNELGKSEHFHAAVENIWVKQKREKESENELVKSES